MSVLVEKANTQRTFPAAYCFITLESLEAFQFITQYINDLFFYDDCPGPKVTVGDFNVGLTAEALRRQNQSRSEAWMEIARDLDDQLIAQGDVHKLQLCSWHAAEAIKKRLTNEGYPSEICLSLATLI